MKVPATLKAQYSPTVPLNGGVVISEVKIKLEY
jgi:hypothetical protein